MDTSYRSDFVWNPSSYFPGLEPGPRSCAISRRSRLKAANVQGCMTYASWYYPTRAASTAAHQRTLSASGKNDPVKLFFANCTTSSLVSASPAATALKLAFM